MRYETESQFILDTDMNIICVNLMNCFLLVWYTSEQEVKQVVKIIEDEKFLFVILNIGSGLGTTSLSGTFGLTFRCGQWSNISAIQSEVMLSLISQSHPPGAARAIMLVVQVFDLSSIHRALNLWSCLLLVTLMIVGLPLCVCANTTNNLVTCISGNASFSILI